MAHIQHKPVQAHESESKKDFKLANGAAANAGSHGKLQSEVRYVNAAKLAATASNKSGGLEIAGFPWQLVAVIAVIVLSILTIIIRSVFGFQ